MAAAWQDCVAATVPGAVAAAHSGASLWAQILQQRRTWEQVGLPPTASQICTHFLAGLCRSGGACGFKHERPPPPPSSPPPAMTGATCTMQQQQRQQQQTRDVPAAPVGAAPAATPAAAATAVPPRVQQRQVCSDVLPLTAGPAFAPAAVDQLTVAERLNAALTAVCKKASTTVTVKQRQQQQQEQQADPKPAAVTVKNINSSAATPTTARASVTSGATVSKQGACGTSRLAAANAFGATPQEQCQALGLQQQQQQQLVKQQGKQQQAAEQARDLACTIPTCTVSTAPAADCCSAEKAPEAPCTQA